MHFSIDQEDATTIFTLKESKLDSRTASQLKAEFLILAQPDIETLIIDLSEVQYCDSAGIAALLLAERQMTATGGAIRLVGLQPDVLALIQLTQLERIFPIFPTVDAALDSEPSFDDDDDDDASASDLHSDDRTPHANAAMTTNFSDSEPIAIGDAFSAANLAIGTMSSFEDSNDNWEEPLYSNLAATADEDDFDDDYDEDDEDPIEDETEFDEEPEDDFDEDEDEDYEEDDEIEDENLTEEDLEDDEFDDLFDGDDDDDDDDEYGPADEDEFISR